MLNQKEEVNEENKVESIAVRLYKNSTFGGDAQLSFHELGILQVDLRIIIDKYKAIVKELLNSSQDLFDKERYDTCIMKLHTLIEVALAAHDIDVLKKAHFLAG